MKARDKEHKQRATDETMPRSTPRCETTFNAPGLYDGVMGKNQLDKIFRAVKDVEYVTESINIPLNVRSQRELY